MPLRYDHPNVLVRREDKGGLSVVGTTSVTRFNIYQRCRIKAVHFFPNILGTSDTFTQTIRTINGTTTTSVGISTMGTAAVGVVANADRIALGASNSPPGVIVGADSQVTITNAVDGTGQTDIVLEYEVLPDAVLT